MSLRIGSLFSGYSGLEMGVQAVLGGTVAWHSEIDPGACKILAHRYPTVPNLGDITAVDWAAVDPVDVLTGGSPCQDVSNAGKRAGMRAGTRSGLWASMCDAIDIIRPGLVVWENVRGVLSAGADSAVEPCPICVGDERDSHLRALGRVVGDLSELGYVGRWGGLRAADVGAPHGRFRVFVVAWPGSDPAGLGRRPQGWDDGLRTPRLVSAATPDASDDGLERRRITRHGRHGSAHGSLAAPDTHGNAIREQPVALTRREGQAVAGQPDVDWGDYGPAVRRWEQLTRPAPVPWETSRSGGRRLSAKFSEWLMGLPAGWVTDVPGLSRNEQLKALGNGVVPAQAAEALRLLLSDAMARAA